MGEEARGDHERPQDATPGKDRERKFDLSVPQVAGSAVAAVVAAKLASNLGVYGTILGAGVVSALGTCGGTFLQHVFRHTGRQVQEVAVQARPGVRRIRGQARTQDQNPTGTGAAASTEAAAPAPADPAPADPDASPTPTPAPDPDPAPTPDPAPQRARSLGWKRPVAALALAFGLTMGGITCYEAIAGENISGHGNGTTVGNAVSGHNSSHSGGTGHTPAPGDGTGTPSDGATGTPHRSDGNGRPGPGSTSAPSTPPSASTPPASTPSTPSAGPGTGDVPGGSPSPSAPPPASAPPATTTPVPTTTPGGGQDGTPPGGVADDPTP